MLDGDQNVRNEIIGYNCSVPYFFCVWMRESLRTALRNEVLTITRFQQKDGAAINKGLHVMIHVMTDK
jgi:hypothetical protein